MLRCCYRAEMDAIGISQVLPAIDEVKEGIAERSEMRKISGSTVVEAFRMSQVVEIEHCALMGPGHQWIVYMLCRTSNGASNIWCNALLRYPEAKVEVKHNAVTVTLPPIKEDLELAAFGTPGENDMIRKQIAIFGPKPEKGGNWTINIFLYDDTVLAFQQVRQKERERGNKLLTARAGLFVANTEDDINIELSPLQPGWLIKGSKIKVIKSRDAWKTPENGTDFPYCSCEIVHVDNTKESFICGINVSHGDETTKAEVVAIFKQEQITQGMMEVYSNSFRWKKTQGAKLVMGDLKCKKKVDRKKIDEMKLGENIVITLPSCTTSSMKGDNITLMNEDKENLLEIRELNVRLSMVDRKKIDEMKLGENIVITLPSCTTSSMKGDNITLMNKDKENLLEIRELNT